MRARGPGRERARAGKRRNEMESFVKTNEVKGSGGGVREGGLYSEGGNGQRGVGLGWGGKDLRECHHWGDLNSWPQVGWAPIPHGAQVHVR